ncbi:hypothetical protein TNCV_3453261 [Trichonephila clavipes]|nr:hypothetical protein TNCV_3453261 [Trichonephila clavipes]
MNLFSRCAQHQFVLGTALLPSNIVPHDRFGNVYVHTEEKVVHLDAHQSAQADVFASAQFETLSPRQVIFKASGFQEENSCGITLNVSGTERERERERGPLAQTVDDLRIAVDLAYQCFSQAAINGLIDRMPHQIKAQNETIRQGSLSSFKLKNQIVETTEDVTETIRLKTLLTSVTNLINKAILPRSPREGSKIDTLSQAHMAT